MNFKNVLKYSKISSLSMALAMSVVFTGCKDDEEVVPTPTPPTPTAKVLVVHASPDAPGVGLLVDNVLINTSAALNYPDNTGYLTVNAGTRNIKVNVFDTPTTVIEANLPLVENKNYTVFAGDVVENITPFVLEDDLTAPAAGKAHVRFVHLSPDAPGVDVLIDGSVEFENYLFSGYSDFKPFAAGTYGVTVNVTNTSTEALNVGAVTFEEGKIYTVFAKGLLAGSGAQALGAEIIVNN
jgi:hypothetical protein